MTDRVYLISRYRADNEHQLEFNKQVARYFCRQIIDEGKVPVAPHLFYPQFLDDDYPDDRELGLELGLSELHRATEFRLVVIDGFISEEMQAEIVEAARLGMQGQFISMTKQEIRQAMKVVR